MVEDTPILSGSDFSAADIGQTFKMRLVMVCRKPLEQLHCRYDGRLPQHRGTYTVELPRVRSVSRRRFRQCYSLSAVWLQHDGSQISGSSVSGEFRCSKLVRAGGVRAR